MNYQTHVSEKPYFTGVRFVDATDERGVEQAVADAEKAQADADAAQARADEAHANAGTAWTHADAAMTRAGEAKTEAIEEAGRLATAAREAAEAEADRLAKAEAKAAQSAAEANAAADALAKAEAARDAAIDSASDDATAKANAAKTAAENAAATDAKAKADAAQAEAIRQAALDATAKANAAKTAAENAAKQHADNLPKMLGGSTAPTGTAPNGSIWFRRDSNNTVIGRWERIGGSWVQQEVSGQLIDNLEAGKITALNTEFAESVIGKLWTQLAIVDRLVATSAWIGGAMIGEDAVEAKHVVASETLSGKVAEFLKLSVADLIAGTAEIDDAVVNKFWAAFGVFDRLTAAGAWVTGDLVVGDTIRTRHLHVTQEMVGEFAKFMHLVVGQMDVNALWADTAWLTAIETASVRLQSTVDSWVTYISGRGMEVISPEGQPTVQLGNYEETGLTLYQDGEATASMTDDGHVSGTIVSANDEFYYQGTELSEHLDLEHLPRGILTRYVAGHNRGPYYGETGIGHLYFEAVPGRMYRVTVVMNLRVTSGGLAYVRMRSAHTGAVSTGWPTVTVDSNLEATRIMAMNATGSTRSQTLTFFWTYPSPDMVNRKPTHLLISVLGAGSGGVEMRDGSEFILEDVGLAPETGFRWNLGGVDGAPPPADPTPTKRRYTKTYGMSWWRTWWQNGNVPSSGVGVKEAAQGRTPYFTTAGIYRSQIGFPSMTSDISGADIEKIEVRVRVIHSHAGSGGNVRLGTHSNSSRPSSYTGTSNAQSTNTHFGRGQEKWITLPSSLHNGFKNGTYRGVTMYTSSTSSTYYVQARPSRFAIRVTYRK